MFLNNLANINKETGKDFALILGFLDKAFTGLDVQYSRIHNFDGTSADTQKMLNDIHYYLISANWINKILLIIRKLEDIDEKLRQQIDHELVNYQNYFRDTANFLRNSLEHEHLDELIYRAWNDPDSIEENYLFQFGFNPESDKVSLNGDEHFLYYPELSELKSRLLQIFSDFSSE